MSAKSHLQIINTISDRLSSAKALPKFCDLSRVGEFHLASLYSEQKADAIIRETVQCGMDFNQDLAIIKALVEYVERLAIAEGIREGKKECLTPRSDGFAAFPTMAGQLAAKEKARKNAYCEALERYAWAAWWDDDHFAASVSDESDAYLSHSNRNVLREISKILPISRLILVKPLTSDPTHDVTILFAILPNGGLASGGACDAVKDFDASCTRALGELARHVASAKRIFCGRSSQDFLRAKTGLHVVPQRLEEIA